MALPSDRSATIKDVAAHAAVSIATVSAVINRNKYVSPALVQRVRESIAALGYERNSLARSLKTQMSHTIGLIISDITNPFFTSIVRGVEDAANVHDYSLILGNTDEDLQKEMRYVRLLESKRADGLIVAVTAGSHEYLHAWPAHLPLVSIDRSLFELGIDVVLVDNVAGARMAVEHLLELGHRRVGIVTGIPGISTTEERLTGYRQALEARGIPLDPTLIAVADSRIDGGERGVQRLLTLNTAQRPTAIFLINGLMVIGALQAIAQAGLRCPQDIALVGFDDFAWASVMHPRLTTVRQPTYEIGQTAARLLFERLQHRDKGPREIRLQPQLIVRESCGASLQSSGR